MENTTFIGTVKNLTPAEGVSQNGRAWKTLTVHVENDEERYPTDVEAVIWGEKDIARFPLDIGDQVRLYLDFHTREHNGKRYNQISIWKVEILQAVAPAYVPQGYMPPQQTTYNQPGYNQPAPQTAQPPAASAGGFGNPNNNLPWEGNSEGPF